MLNCCRSPVPPKRYRTEQSWRYRTFIPECQKRGWEVLPAESMRKGFPDVMVLIPGGRVAFVELKTHGGKLDPDQIRWQNTLGASGHDVWALWPDDYEEFFAYYGG